MALKTLLDEKNMYCSSLDWLHKEIYQQAHLVALSFYVIWFLNQIAFSKLVIDSHRQTVRPILCQLCFESGQIPKLCKKEQHFCDIVNNYLANCCQK